LERLKKKSGPAEDRSNLAATGPHWQNSIHNVVSRPWGRVTETLRKSLENTVSMPRSRGESTSILLNKTQRAALTGNYAEIVRIGAGALQNVAAMGGD
jgi:hypothetical protein